MSRTTYPENTEEYIKDYVTAQLGSGTAIVGISDIGGLKALKVDVIAGSPTNGSIFITGSTFVIKDNASGSLATVRDLPSNDALNVAITDANGSQVTSFGGGVEYTEGDTDTTITGKAMMGEAPGDILKVVKTRSSGELVTDPIGFGSYSFQPRFLSAAGETTLVSPKTGSAIRLKALYVSNNDAFTTPIVSFRFGTGSYFFRTLLAQSDSRFFPLGGNNLQGSPTENLVGSLNTGISVNVDVTVIYEDI